MEPNIVHVLNDFSQSNAYFQLYARPTACHEPARLHLKTWDRIDNRDFACKPTIDTPNRYAT